jgi:hypothetical protein
MWMTICSDASLVTCQQITSKKDGRVLPTRTKPDAGRPSPICKDNSTPIDSLEKDWNESRVPRDDGHALIDRPCFSFAESQAAIRRISIDQTAKKKSCDLCKRNQKDRNHEYHFNSPP